MKSILIIGLGRFGRHLALDLASYGVEVTVIDKDEEKVKRISSSVSKAFTGDCMNPSVLQSIKVKKFNKCFVCISGNLQSSLEITAQLKELGAAYIISKTDRDVHKKFLSEIGADEVIYVERAAAERTAKKYSANNAFEYIELTNEYAISEIIVPVDWVGLSIKELDLRARVNVNIIGIKNEENVVPVIDADYTLAHKEHLIVAGLKKDIIYLLDK
jgi:trk system potassium uptake protein TrkA